MKIFNLNVSSITREVFSGIVKTIQITGDKGEMCIYPNHSPLLTIINPGRISIFTMDNYMEHIYLSGGFMEVQPDMVIVLVDSAVRGENLNEASILQMKYKLEKEMSNVHNNVNYVEFAFELSKIVAQLKVVNLVKNRNICK